MQELILPVWLYFGACGFVTDGLIDGEKEAYARTKPAPNIRGYWIRKDAIIGVVDWRKQKGIACSSVYAQGAEKPVHVIGTADEILKKLRE